MRKIFLAFALLAVLFLSGCDFFVEKQEDLPGLVLIGESQVTIGLNEEYLDPGVEITGDFSGVEVQTDNQIDNTEYGIYYIYYTVIYDGARVNMDRRVRVARGIELDFNINLSVISTGPNDLTFGVDIDDEDGNLINGRAILYLLGEEVTRLPVVAGTNILEFKELANQTGYILSFEGSYIESGVEYTLDDYDIFSKTTIIPPSDYPRLEAIGEKEVHLSVGEEYVELGVTIIGYQDLEITTTDNVDTSIAGTYVVVYTVEFNLATIYEHRTVIVEELEVNDHYLQLVGANSIDVVKDTAFVDPGAVVVGDSDAVITVTLFDISTVGTYTITYSAMVNDILQHITRTINVVEPEEVDFGIVVAFVEAIEDELTFSVTVVDPDGLINSPFGSLFLGDTKIESQSYSNGMTTITFDELLQDTTYTFVLEGTYLEDGSPVTIGEYTLDGTTLKLTDIQPYIVLNGEAEIDVMQYSEFVDPGAFAPGNPDAEIIASMILVDTYVIDTYTIVYRTTINGTEYSVSRVVNIVNPNLVDFGVELAYVSNTESSLTYTLTVNDQYSLLNTHTVRLYEFTTLVEERQFVEGVNNFEFTNLKPGTEYSIYTYGTYTLNGQVESIGDYYRSDSTIVASTPVITLTSYVIGIDDIDVLINVADEHSQIVSMTVSAYDDTDYQEDYADLVVGDNQILLDQVMYDHHYRLIVEYTYMIYGTYETADVEIELLDFSTLTPPTPELTSMICDRTGASFTCDLEWDMDGFESGDHDRWYFVYVESGSTSTLVYFEDPNGGTSLTYDGLNPEYDYHIKVYADYIVSDTGKRYIMLIENYDLDITLVEFD